MAVPIISTWAWQMWKATGPTCKEEEESPCEVLVALNAVETD